MENWSVKLFVCYKLYTYICIVSYNNHIIDYTGFFYDLDVYFLLYVSNVHVGVKVFRKFGYFLQNLNSRLSWNMKASAPQTINDFTIYFDLSTDI